MNHAMTLAAMHIIPNVKGRKRVHNSQEHSIIEATRAFEARTGPNDFVFATVFTCVVFGVIGVLVRLFEILLLNHPE